MGFCFRGRWSSGPGSHGHPGETAAFVGIDGHYGGHIVLRDNVRSEAANTITRLVAAGVGVVMSIGLILVAARGFLPGLSGALAQELVDPVAILGALRALKAARDRARPTSNPPVRETLSSR